MNELKTPREFPEGDDWTDEIEDLLGEFGEVALCYQYLHSFSQRKYKKRYHHFQIPIIVLSTLTGTANFAADSYVPDGYKQGFSAGVGTLNLAAGIMGTLLAFLKYAEIYEGHRIAALAWAKLSRSIEIELSLQDGRRKACKDFLKVMRAEYDNLMESSPSIDLDVINMFNNKFEDKYKNVRKPVIVNGLREIIPYKQKVSQKIKKDNVTATSQGPPKKKEEKPPMKTSISEEEIIIPVLGDGEQEPEPEEEVKDEESVEP